MPVAKICNSMNLMISPPLILLHLWDRYGLYSTRTSKPFALGFYVRYGPQCEGFALPIPTCWYQKTLETEGDPLSTQHDPKREQVEYGRVGSPRVGARIGHVDFMLFVSISVSGRIWAIMCNHNHRLRCILTHACCSCQMIPHITDTAHS